MKRAIPVLLMLALMVIGIALIPAAIGKLQDIRIEATRTKLPGQRTVELEARKYIFWVETRGEFGKYDPSPEDIPAEIRPASGGAPLQLDNYGGSFTTQSGGRDAAAFATVTPPEAGDYVILGGRFTGTPSPSVVLGNPTGKSVLRVVLGAGLAIVGFIGAIIAVILAIVLPRKDKDKPAPPSPVTGGDPFNAG